MVEGTIKVKLVLDTTQFDAALDRVKQALLDLDATPIRVSIIEGEGKHSTDASHRLTQEP